MYKHFRHKILRKSWFTCLAQRQRCKLVFSATRTTRSYENLSVSKLVKTAINTAITVKPLKLKVTLLDTCEKLKMSHEHNVTFKITQRSVRLVIVNTSHWLKCGSGCKTEWIHGTDMEIKCGNGTDLDKIASF